MKKAFLKIYIKSANRFEHNNLFGLWFTNKNNVDFKIKCLQQTLNELHIQNIDKNLASQFWNKLGVVIQEEIKQSSPAVGQMLEEDYPKLLKNYYEMTKKLNYDQFKYE